MFIFLQNLSKHYKGVKSDLSEAYFDKADCLSILYDI